MHMYYKFIEIGFWTSASGVYIQNAISNYTLLYSHYYIVATIH